MRSAETTCRVRGPGIPVAPRDHRIDAFFPLSLPLCIFLLFSFLSLPFPSNGSFFTASHKSTWALSYNANIDRRYSNTSFWSVRMVLFFFFLRSCVLVFCYIWKPRNLIREKLIERNTKGYSGENFVLEEIKVSNGF